MLSWKACRSFQALDSSIHSCWSQLLNISPSLLLDLFLWRSLTNTFLGSSPDLLLSQVPAPSSSPPRLELRADLISGLLFSPPASRGAQACDGFLTPVVLLFGTARLTSSPDLSSSSWSCLASHISTIVVASVALSCSLSPPPRIRDYYWWEGGLPIMRSSSLVLESDLLHWDSSLSTSSQYHKSFCLSFSISEVGTIVTPTPWSYKKD